MFTLFTAACGAMDPEQISMEESTGFHTVEEKILVEALDSDPEVTLEAQPTDSSITVELVEQELPPLEVAGGEDAYGPNPGVFKDPNNHAKGVVVEGIFENPGINAPQDEIEISDTLSASAEKEPEPVREELNYEEADFGYVAVDYTFDEEEDCDPEDC